MFVLKKTYLQAVANNEKLANIALKLERALDDQKQRNDDLSLANTAIGRVNARYELEVEQLQKSKIHLADLGLKVNQENARLEKELSEMRLIAGEHRENHDRLQKHLKDHGEDFLKRAVVFSDEDYRVIVEALNEDLHGTDIEKTKCLINRINVIVSNRKLERSLKIAPGEPKAIKEFGEEMKELFAPVVKEAKPRRKPKPLV